MTYKYIILALLLVSSVSAAGVLQDLSFEIVVDNNPVNSSSIEGVIVQPQIEAFVMRKGDRIENEEDYLWKINDKELVKDLVERKEKDSDNFNDILSIAVKMDMANREDAVREVMNMDREFVNSFSKVNDTALNSQVNDYLTVVEAPVKFQIRENYILNFFGKKVDIDGLIDSIWDSFGE